MRSNIQKMSSPKIDKDKKPNMTSLIRGEGDVILGFYQSTLEYDIFRILERIESNQPYFTTLVVRVVGFHITSHQE